MKYDINHDYNDVIWGNFNFYQDWLTLLGWEQMELFYHLPCQVFHLFQIILIWIASCWLFWAITKDCPIVDHCGW